MERRILGGPYVARAEKILEQIDRLVEDLCKKEAKRNATTQIFAIREAAHTAGFAVAAMVWAHQGSVARAAEIEQRSQRAYHALAGGVSAREKQYAVVQTLAIGAQQNRLQSQAPADVLKFFCDRIRPAFPESILSSVTFEDLAPAMEAAARKPGRRAGAKTGRRTKSKWDIINQFLTKLGVGAASGPALEKAQEREPVIPRLPE
ncbi:MAG TPA: hypothetical protein VK524_26650 [Polyangiaceae bacterium]|nr:hypothetical protein [Polyangiaceae bacterium]